VLGEVHGVEHVHEDPTAGRGGVVPPLRLVAAGARGVDDAQVVDDDGPDVAELTGGDYPPSGDDLGKEQVVVHHAQDQAGRLHGLDRGHGVGGDRRERFLGQDVLAGRRGGDDELAVQVLRRADVDQVDVIAGEKFPRVQVHLLGGEAGDRTAELEPVRGGVGEADQLEALGVGLVGGDVEVEGHVAAADDPHPERSGHDGSLRGR